MNIKLPTIKPPKLTKVELNALFTAVIMLLVMAATKTYIFSLATGALLVVPTVALYALMGTLTYVIAKAVLSTPVSE